MWKETLIYWGLKTLDVLFWLFAAAVVLSSIPAVAAGIEQVEVIHVETLVVKACPPKKNANVPAWIEDYNKTSGCSQGPAYRVLFRRKNGFTGETIMKSYPYGKFTSVTFCYEGQGKPERPCHEK
jgi:hypothetical protein